MNVLPKHVAVDDGDDIIHTIVCTPSSAKVKRYIKVSAVRKSREKKRTTRESRRPT